MEVLERIAKGTASESQEFHAVLIKSKGTKMINPYFQWCPHCCLYLDELDRIFALDTNILDLILAEVVTEYCLVLDIWVYGNPAEN